MLRPREIDPFQEALDTIKHFQELFREIAEICDCDGRTCPLGCPLCKIKLIIMKG
jgi:hypothetical protein